MFFNILDASSEDTDMLDNMYFEEEDWGVCTSYFTTHYNNMPLQYTTIFSADHFQLKNLDIFLIFA